MGNDYIIVDPADGYTSSADTAKALCNRRSGIGADGVVFGPKKAGPSPVSVAIRNSDGTPCARSANGLRAYALHAGAESVLLDTGFGSTVVTVLDRNAGLVAVDLGVPRFDEIDIAVELTGQTTRVTLLDNGNPHAVAIRDKVSEEVAAELGPTLVAHPRFPTLVNTAFAAILDPGTLKVEVWERGAGGVLASGSGGCAAAAAAHRLGHVGTDVEVVMRGGRIHVTIAPDGAVSMSGAVGLVMTGCYLAGR